MPSATLVVNPPPTPIRGLGGLVKYTATPPATPPGKADLPPAPRFHDLPCGAYVAALAAAVAEECAMPDPYLRPQLTPGQRRVFDAERARLTRFVSRGKHAAVVDLLDDLAGQAPAVDAVIAEETARRRETAAARPTLALAMRENRRA